MSKHLMRLVIFILFLTGIVWYIFGIIKNNKPNSIVKKLENIKINEVLKAEELTRELFELVGPEQTIKMINEANIPSGGVKHTISHQIGAAIYQKYGPSSITLCDDDGLNGCLHGLIIEAINDIGFDGVYEMIDECKTHSNLAYKMCAHGAGHAFLAYSNYNLDHAIKMCDALSKTSEDSKSLIRWCGAGLFMENAHGDHNGKLPILHPSLSTSDIMKPCNTVKAEYRETCYLNQAGWWHQLNNNDIAATLAQCSLVPVEYQNECADNIARLLNTMFPDQVDLITKYCRKMPGTLANDCIESAALSSIFVSNYSDTPKSLCNNHINPEKCKEVLLNELVWQGAKDQEVYDWCVDFIGDDYDKCEILK